MCKAGLNASETYETLTIDHGRWQVCLLCFRLDYTQAVAISGGFWLLGAAYSPYYSAALVLWATTFIEYWKIVERKIAVQWGTYGAFRVEKL